MKEVPCRRENLHSIISKISGTVEASHCEEACSADDKNITQNDKANSELNVADEQHKAMKNMFAEDANKISKNVSETNRKDDAAQQANPLETPFSCQLCHVGFLTQRELHLHTMCHGIYTDSDVHANGLKNTAIDGPNKSETFDDQGQDDNDKEFNCRKSPVIQKQTYLTNQESTSDSREHDRLSPMYELTDATTDNSCASSIPGNQTTNQDSNASGNSATSSPTANNELGHGKVVDMLSLATATRGFKEPGSVWCSLCKCTVEKGHVCKVHQPSYHAEKTEEGFTCELCGRYYNQKRKLRTHLRNRHKGFRLQEDEGYMCWQCWQAFPEIKILEQHIVAVHGHESRRQNSTWRPFTTPTTLPSSGETTDDQATSASDLAEDNTQNISACVHENPKTTSLKRQGNDITNEYPAKRISGGIVCNKVLNVGEVNGKIVVNDSFLLTTEVSACPQPKSPNFESCTAMKATSEPPLEVTDNIPYTSDPGTLTRIVHGENVPKTLPFNQPHYLTNQTANPNANITIGDPTTNDLVNPSVMYSSTATKKKTLATQKPQQCPHCPELFSKKYILQLHIQQNHGENMHCFFCSTSCGTKEALSIHIKDIHTDEMKNGKCPICQCKCLGELHQHIVQYHYKDLLTRKDKDRVLSTCPICHQTTTDAYHLRWHVLNEHGGMVLPGEQQEGNLEETSSDSGSSVSSEGRLGSMLPERTTAITKGTNGTTDVAGDVEEKAGGGEKPDTDELEIVFVSDKNIESDWSKQCGMISHDSKSDSPTGGDIGSKELPVPGNPVETIKKPADSSGNILDGLKFNQQHVAADNVDSTTGQEESKSVTEEEVHLPASRPEQKLCDYQSLSEQACIFCFNSFNEKKTLVTHLKIAHGWLDTFTCPICFFEGTNYSNVVEHFCTSHFHPIDDTLTQSEVKCLKCDIIFQDIVHLKKHSTALHSFQIPCVPRYNTFKCRHCNIIFEKKFDAQKHFDVYHLFRIRYKCETCRMGFTARYDFQEHVTCNHPELVKSFCPVCGLGFEVNADLEEHVFEMHRRKAQFFCAKCRNEFGDRFHVHMHIRSNCCVQWADSNFECLDCLTAFSSISELRIHCNQKNCKPSEK